MNILKTTKGDPDLSSDQDALLLYEDYPPTSFTTLRVDEQDVIFGEDASRKRKGNVAENFNIILKSVMSLISNDKTKKISKKNKRFNAALDHKYRETLLGF